VKGMGPNRTIATELSKTPVESPWSFLTVNALDDSSKARIRRTKGVRHSFGEALSSTAVGWC
jgi:hypothetical protein